MLRKALLAASALAAVTISTPSQAATFVLNGLNNIQNPYARAGFQAAANYWASTLTNNVSITINVGFASLAPGVLGQASSTTYAVNTGDVVGALAGSQTSLVDAAAVASIAPIAATGATTFLKAGYVNDTNQTGVDTTKMILDNDGSANNTNMRGNQANLKVLGYEGFGTTADATITFNSDFRFDFDARDGITAGSYDFVGVAVHEFGHALGFVSSVDYYDLRGCPDSPNCASQSTINFNASQFAGLSVADLFRYSEAGARNITPGQETYFSVDGGLTEMYGSSNFSTGRYNGDEEQASHWKAPGTCNQAQFIGIMNPYLCSGMTAVVKGQDLALLDAVGWTLSDDARDNGGYTRNSAQIFAAFVPEPATWMQLILGFGVIGGSYRAATRRRRLALAA